jgi:anti-sigma regulatory factor (Ser/Thr protein kinase)
MARVREWVRDRLADLGRAARDDAILVVTELLANAYDHGNGPGLLVLARYDEPSVVLVGLEDNRADAYPVVLAEGYGCRGRGMLLVDRIAERWGVNSDAGRPTKSVWARLRCAEPGE